MTEKRMSKSPYQIASEKPYLDQLRRFVEGRRTGEPDPLFMAGRMLVKKFLLVLITDYPEVVKEIENRIRGGHE